MKPTIMALTCALALALTAGSARADSILDRTITDPYYLGHIDFGIPASEADEAQYINCLLGYTVGCSATGQTYAPTALATTALPQAFSAGSSRTITDANGNPHTGIDVTNWTYLYAKYDGPNFGADVWYVKDLDTTVTIPQYGNPAKSQYAMSHYTLYNPTASVPDGGVTLVLLGGALVGLETLRRRVRA